MRLILLGTPGAGKGEQATRLSKKFGIPHISTGELLRGEMDEGTPVGCRISGFVNKGELVSDDITQAILEVRLQEADCFSGFILDGFPRTRAQAEALDELLEARGSKVDAVIEFELDDDIVVERITGRFSCSNCGVGYHRAHKKPAVEGVCDVCGSKEFVQRADDGEEKIRTRLALYHEQTAPILPYYEQRGILRSVDGTKDMDDVTEQLKEVLASAN